MTDTAAMESADKTFVDFLAECILPVSPMPYARKPLQHDMNVSK
jgi:hypothetical protein